MASKQTQNLTELTSVDTANDKIPIYDASDPTELKFATPNNIAPVPGSATTTTAGIVELATDAETTTGTDTTRATTPSNILAVMKLLNPVGTIREFNVSTNPGTLLGFGTWVAHGTGKVTIAIDSGDATMDTVDETGGAKTIDISHTHTGPSHTHTYSGTTSTYTADVPTGGSSGANKGGTHSHTYSGTTDANGTGNTGTSGSATQSIMNPFIVVYRWVRTV
jgi:hypothetical protein